MKLFLLQMLVLTLAGVPQYDESTYDAHPYVVGERVVKEQSSQSCQRHKRRLCTRKDLEILLQQKRNACTEGWVYYTKRGEILSTVIVGAWNDCNTNTTDTIMYPYYDWHRAKNVFLCNVKAKSFGAYKGKPSEYCTGNGVDYKGTVNKTWSGKTCERWVDTDIADFNNKTLVGPDSFNFCRNPNGSERTWCFIKGKHKNAWEYCNVACYPSGEFQPVKLTLYDDNDDLTKKIDIELTKGKFILYAHSTKKILWNPEYERYAQVRLECSNCIAVINNKHTLTPQSPHLSMWYNTYDGLIYSGQKRHKIWSISLLDPSPDVVLLPRATLIDHAVYQFFKICDVDTVDRARYMLDISEDENFIGIVVTKGVWMIYMYGVERNKPNHYKKAWCCENEHPRATVAGVYTPGLKDVCSKKVREVSFEHREKKYTYKIPRRFCTMADIRAHFTNYRLKMGGVNSCFVEYSPGTIRSVESSGRLTSLGWDRVCCCDDDCFPLFYVCAQDGDCCSGECRKGSCMAGEIGRNDQLFNPDSLGKMSNWQMFGFLFLGLGSLSLLFKCCFSRRKPLSGYVESHSE